MEPSTLQKRMRYLLSKATSTHWPKFLSMIDIFHPLLVYLLLFISYKLQSRVVCTSIHPFDMSITSKSPFDKAHVRPLRAYSSIFKHNLWIFVYFQRIFKECLPSPFGRTRPSVYHIHIGRLYPHVRLLWQPCFKGPKEATYPIL
jgi:hypothetical protein